VIPLSGDCPSNPFRVDLRAIRHYDFLLHAVMAVSTQHLAKKNDCAVLLAEMHQHWSTALHLFSQSLNNPEVVPLLDTLLVLVSLEVGAPCPSRWSCPLIRTTDYSIRIGHVGYALEWGIPIAAAVRVVGKMPLQPKNARPAGNAALVR